MLTSSLLQPFLTGLSRTLGGGHQDPEAAIALLASFHPESPIQAMLAAQAIALHHAAMDCFARAMQTGPDDHATAARLHRNAASLTRAFTATLRTLQRCQAQEGREDHMQPEPPQPRPQPRQPAPPPKRVRHNAQQDPMQPEPAAEASPPSHGLAEDLMQRENPAPRAWEELTEAEQFAVLYPERVAAGATNHEDADLWLPKFTREPAPAPLPPAR